MIWWLMCLVIKKLNPIINEAFITGRKLNISLVFISQSYFALPRNIRLNSMHYFLMKIPNKQELQQIAFNHSSDIDFEDFMNQYKKYQNHNLFLVTDATLASSNPFRLRKKFLERIQKLIMTTDVKVRYEKLQYNINREAAIISALASGRIDKHEYLTGEEILPSNQRQTIEQAPLGKVFENQTENQVGALKSLDLSV